MKSISLVENNDNKRELYIIPIDDAKAYKVIFNDPINPLSVNWKDNNNLYIIDNNESSSIYTYNLRNNETNLVNTYDLNIIGIKNIKSNAIITALEENKLNKKIIFTNNWQDLKFVDYGFNVKFIDENRICYLKNTEKEDKNALYIYDLDTNKKMDVIDLNLSNYSIITENKLLLIEKNQSNNDYTVHGYDLGDEVLTTISNINSDNVYYNIEKNLIYVNLTIPFENEKHELIYAVDLKKLSATP